MQKFNEERFTRYGLINRRIYALCECLPVFDDGVLRRTLDLSTKAGKVRPLMFRSKFLLSLAITLYGPNHLLTDFFCIHEHQSLSWFDGPLP